VLLFRADQRIWQIGTVDHDYIGHPEYAYTHWQALPDKPADVRAYPHQHE
jgi:hypothetical protein